jgi:hypothetical protein
MRHMPTETWIREDVALAEGLLAMALAHAEAWGGQDDH